MNSTEALDEIMSAAAAHNRFHPDKALTRALKMWAKPLALRQRRLAARRQARAAAAAMHDLWQLSGLDESGVCQSGTFFGPLELAVSAASKKFPGVSKWEARGI